MKKEIWATAAAGCIVLSSVFLGSAASSLFPEQTVSMAPTACMAHPGNTNSAGCHTCRTNCAKWGLATGEYHCHNGGSSGSSGGSSGGTGGVTGEDPAAAQQAEAARLQQEQEAAARAAAEAEAKRIAEAQAKAKAEEEARKKAEQEKKDREQGEKDGYAFKTSHPNDSQPELKDKSAAYKEGYPIGFARADEELEEKSEELGKEDGAKAGIELEQEDWLTSIPKTVKTDTYKRAYQEEAEQSEMDYFARLKSEAIDKSYTDYVAKTKTIRNSKLSESDKGEKYFQEQYELGLKEAKAKIAALKEEVETQGKADGHQRAKKSNTLYKDLKGTGNPTYKDMDAIYEEAYETAKAEENRKVLLCSGGAVALAGAGGYCLMRKRKAGKIHPSMKK